MVCHRRHPTRGRQPARGGAVLAVAACPLLVSALVIAIHLHLLVAAVVATAIAGTGTVARVVDLALLVGVIAASTAVGEDAHRRGRSRWVFGTATFILPAYAGAVAWLLIRQRLTRGGPPAQ